MTAHSIRSLAGLLLLAVLCLFTSHARAGDDMGQSSAHARFVPRADWGSVDGLPWAEPTPSHPMGTILVSYAMKRAGMVVSEWDLSRREVIRTTSLRTGVAIEGVRLARRAGGVVAVGSTDGTPGVLVLLSSSLEFVKTQSIGPAARAVVASSGKDIFAAWLIPGKKQLMLARFDARTGAVLVRRAVPLDVEGDHSWAAPLGQLLVVDGRLWLGASSLGEGLLLSVSLDLQHLTRATPDIGPFSLFPMGDRLGVLSLKDRRLSWSVILPDLTMMELRRVGNDDSRPQLGAYDPRYGLGMGLGYVVDMNGDERFVGRAPIDPSSLFWAHGRLVTLGAAPYSAGAIVGWIDPA
jgi:hypothetical protein